MNQFAIALTYLRSRLSLSVLHVILMALGVSMMTALILFGNHLQSRLYKDSAGIDAVVGAKGSPLQLILSSVQHMDIPTGNISLKDANRIKRHPKIRQAIPVSLGDSYKRFRIVGTEPDYVKWFNAELADGSMWHGTMEAVIGAQVAKEAGLSIGDHFVGNHGLMDGGHAHDEHPYKVVGILRPTGRVIDRLMITSLNSVWDIHHQGGHDHDHHNDEHAHDSHDHHDHHDHKEHHHDKHAHDEHSHDDHGHKETHHDHHDHHEEADDREVTALLVKYRTRSAALSFPREINSKTTMQAASPAFEMARLISLIGLGSNTLMTIGGILIAISLAGVLIALFNAVRERRYDLALFRTFGASRRAIISIVVMEGMCIAILGSIIGVLAGYGGLLALGNMTEKGMELGLNHITLLPEVGLLWLVVLFISLVACLIPAWQVYRFNIREMLIHGRG